MEYTIRPGAEDRKNLFHLQCNRERGFNTRKVVRGIIAFSLLCWGIFYAWPDNSSQDFLLMDIIKVIYCVFTVMLGAFLVFYFGWILLIKINIHKRILRKTLHISISKESIKKNRSYILKDQVKEIWSSGDFLLVVHKEGANARNMYLFARCEMETVRAVLREYGYPEVIEKTKF